MFFTIVSERTVKMLHRFGRYTQTLQPGINFFVPFINSIEVEIPLKEEAIAIDSQTAFTQDNVAILIDGVVFFKVVDPFKAAYNIENYRRALTNLAMTSMRSELGKINLDNLFQSRKELNNNIKNMLEKGIQSWGLECHRYEVLRIDPPHQIKKKMQLEAEAERLKRRDIILSEASKISKINIAEGLRISNILVSEGHAKSIDIIAEKEKEGLLNISKVVSSLGNNGNAAFNYVLNKNYYSTYKDILRRGNVTVIPNSKEGGSSDLLAAVSLMMNAKKGRSKSSDNVNTADFGTSSVRQETISQDKTKFKEEDTNKFLDDIDFFTSASLYDQK